jgi:hypothetical protein
MGEGTPARSEIIDPLLWRDAQLMLGRHAEPGYDDRCVWCGFRWPCPARRLAERALRAACRPHRGVNGHRTDSYRPEASEPDGYRPDVSERAGHGPEVPGSETYRREGDAYRSAEDAHRSDADLYRPGEDPYRTGTDAYRTHETYRTEEAYRTDGHDQGADGGRRRRDEREAAGMVSGGDAGEAGWNEPGRGAGGDPHPVRWRAPRPAGWSDTRPDGWDEERSRAWARTLPAGWNDVDTNGRAGPTDGAGAVGSPVSVPAARDADQEHLVGSG